MKMIVVALASLTCASGALAQGTYASNLYPVVQDVPGRWIWRLRTDTVVPVNVPGIGSVKEFWMLGENRGTSAARSASVRIGLDCAGRRFVRERMVARDAAGNVTQDVTIGDHPRNWTSIAVGTSIDGARRLLCAQ